MLLWILATIGATHIMVESEFMLPFRSFVGRFHKKLNYLVNCNQCMGTWVGWITGYFVFDSWTAVLLAGPASSFLARLGSWLITLLETKSRITL